MDDVLAGYNNNLLLAEHKLEESLKDLRETCNLIRSTSLQFDPLTAIKDALQMFREGESTELSNMTEKADGVANHMSHSIKVKDIERLRLLKLIEMIKHLDATRGNLQSLEKRIRDEDLPGLVDSYTAILDRPEKFDEAFFNRFQENFQHKLQEIRQILLDRLNNAVMPLASSDDASEPNLLESFKLFSLYVVLEESNRGIELICGKVRKFVKQLFKPLLDINNSTTMGIYVLPLTSPYPIDRSDFCYANSCERISGITKEFLQWCLLRIPKDPQSSACATVAVGGCIFTEGEAALIELVRLFREAHFSDMSIAKPDTRQLDLLCTEIGLIARTILEGFLAERSTFCSKLSKDELQRLPIPSRLIDSLEEVLCEGLNPSNHEYGGLEMEYLRQGVILAISLNQLENANVSTSTEDVFFVLQKSFSRCKMIASIDFMLPVLHMAQNVLRNEFLQSIQRRARQLYPDQKNGDCIFITLNDLTIAKTLLECAVDNIRSSMDQRLFSFDLLRSADGIFPIDLGAKDKLELESSLNDLELVRLELQLQQQKMLEQIFSVHIKSKLAPGLVYAFREITTNPISNLPTVPVLLTETRDDVLLSKIISIFETSVWPTLDKYLVEESRTLLTLFIAKEIANFLEEKILHLKLTESTIECIERSVRRIANYLDDHSEFQAREHFKRLFRIFLVLTADSWKVAETMLAEQGFSTSNELQLLREARIDWH